MSATSRDTPALMGSCCSLTGFSHFFTDPRYAIEASEKITCRVHIEKKALLVGAAAVIKRKRLKKIGFESAWLRYEDYLKVKEDLPLGSALHPIGRIVEEQRMVKSDHPKSRSSARASPPTTKRIRRPSAASMPERANPTSPPSSIIRCAPWGRKKPLLKQLWRPAYEQLCRTPTRPPTGWAKMNYY